MYAIIKTGGKQYKVTEGQEIFIEKLTAEENETVEIPVVAVGNEDGTKRHIFYYVFAIYKGYNRKD